MRWIRGYDPITIKNNGKLVSEPTQVAKLFNSYFIEIAEKLQRNFNLGTDEHTTVNQITSLSIFYTHEWWWNNCYNQGLKKQNVKRTRWVPQLSCQ
jgi:hypothetical protein